MARAREQQNLLTMRPRRLFGHEILDGRVKVLIPRFRSRWLAWLQRRLRKPYLRLGLDDIGTAVWLESDGQRTVAEIGDGLRERFGEKVEPVWDRLGLFLAHMHRGQLIEWCDGAPDQE